MKMNRTTTVAVLGLALLACALPVLASETVELPAQANRIWAPAGDVVGQDNNYTATFQAKDSHGNEAKGAEDWQLVQKYSGAGLFGWFNTRDNGTKYWLRASGDNGTTGGMVGKFDLGGNAPGGFKWSIDYRNFDFFSDRTSEMRSATFAAPPSPPELDSMPGLNWRRAGLKMAYLVSDQVSVTGGFNRKCREGDKGSLLRGFGNSGDSVPSTKAYDTTTNEIWGGIGFASGSFGSNLHLSYRGSDGTRAVADRHAYDDDRTRFGAKLGLSYLVSDKVKLTGAGSTYKLENTGSEGLGADVYSLNGESKSNAGQLGLLAKLGKSADLAASAVFRKLDADSRTSSEGSLAQASDRQRDSQDYRIGLSYRGLAKTHLRLGYRYGTSNLEEVVAEGDLPGGANVGQFQIKDKTTTRQNLRFHGKYRFGPTASLKLAASWQKMEIDQKDPATGGSDDWFYWMGDRNRDRLKWELALRTRPWRSVHFDIGHQAIDQTYERLENNGSETTWTANRAFANVNWMAMDDLTVYGLFSYGVEKYDLKDDPTPTANMNAIAYSGTTMRFTPGMTWQITNAMDFDGHYEGVRFEDTGNEDVIRVLQSDHDRLVLRAGYRIRERMKLSASYVRNEFNENRWDDYIHHLYTASISGTF